MRNLLKFIVAVGLSSVMVVASLSGAVSAVTAADWKAGRIIDDVVFENSTAMSVQDIQNFLNTKINGGSCDKYGQRTLESDFWAPDYNSDGRATHAEYAKYRGYGDNFRFTCLVDYYEVPKTAPGAALPVNNYGQYNSNGSPVIPAGSKSAAQLIYDSAQKYRINPKALLVKLATESAGPLTSDDWPFPKQYYYAMGAHCPDSGPNGSANCDSNYAGFSIQMDEAASLLRWYLDSMTQSWWTYKKPWANNSILWNVVETGCGAGNVYIETKATAALYTYTPYQPNQAALNNMYGTGDGCSAYGNRNFWRVWNDWFGSTLGSLAVSPLSITKDAANQAFTGKPVRVSFTVKNESSNPYTFKNIGVAVRGPGGQNMDPGWDSNVTIAPWTTYTYSKTFTPINEGGYQVYVSSYAAQDTGWRECEINGTQSTCYNPIVFQYPVVIMATPTVTRQTTGQLIDSFRQRQAFSVSYTLKNTSSLYSVKPGSVMIAGRSNTGVNRDLSRKDAGVLAPGASYTYTNSRTLDDAPGTSYNFYVSTTKDNGQTYEEQQFVPANAAVSQNFIRTIKPATSLIQGPQITSGQAAIGAKSTVTMKVQNFADQPVDLGRIGVTVRGPQGQNKDPLWQRVDSLSSTVNDGVYTYQAQFTPTDSGNWHVSYMQTTADYSSWSSGNPVSESGSVQRSITVPVIESVKLLQGPKVTGSTHAGQITTVTMKLKTLVPGPVDLGRIGVTVRGPQGQNKDPLWQRVDSLTSSVDDGVYTYQATFTPDSSGNWSIGYMYTSADYGVWDPNKLSNYDNSVKRSISLPVLPQATVTTGVDLSSASLGVQQVSFTVTNHSATDIDLGKVGVAVRDPDGLNRDPLWSDFVIPANSTKTYTAPLSIGKEGTWTFAVTSYKNGVWSSTVPVAEDSSTKTYSAIEIK